jgi:serine/threonine-protein kinase
MATVHLGRLLGPEGFSRTVAIKQLHPQFALDPEFIAMFLDEARLASRIHHPNVVSPLDVVREGEELFIIMDYVHGESLSRLSKLAPARSIPPEIAAGIISQTLLGLHAAHEATDEGGEPLGIVHRDVSPHNVLVTAQGLVRVVDFGIAKAQNRSHHTEAGKLKGKLGYMSPEQFKLGSIDRRADVFAAGIVLWELLTGQRLFAAESPAIIVDRILNAETLPPSEVNNALAPALDRIVLQALERDPERRFQTARQMAVELARVISPASALEVGEWVEEVAASDLRERARRLVGLEALSVKEFTRRVPLPEVLLSPIDAGGREPHVESVRPTELAAHSAAAPFERFRPLTVAALIALAASLWLAYRPPRLALPHRAASSASDLHGSNITMPSATPAALYPALNPLAVSREPGPAPAPRSPAAPPLALLQPALRARPANPTAPAAKAVRAAPSRDSAVSPVLPVRKLAESVRPTCAVPYVVDARGVKRFKEECF